MQIDIVHADGTIRTQHLDSNRGIANIGRNWANEIVLDGPGVAEFHAMLDYRPGTCRVLVLDNMNISVRRQIITIGQSIDVGVGDTFDVGSFTLVIRSFGLREQVAESADLLPVDAVTVEKTFVPGGISPILSNSELNPHSRFGTQSGRSIFLGIPVGEHFQPETEDTPDLRQMILMEILDRKRDVEVREAAYWNIKIKNGGRRVSIFQVNLEIWDRGQYIPISADDIDGVDFQHTDPQKKGNRSNEVNLNEDETANIQLRITPPHHPKSLAGVRRLAVVVTSSMYPGHENRRIISLNIKPFYQIVVGEISPGQQTITYGQAGGRFELPIRNLGNEQALIQISGTDSERRCIFEFEEVGKEPQIDVRKFPLRAGQETLVAIRVRPQTRQLVSSKATEHKLHWMTEVVGGIQPPESRHSVLYQRPRYRYWQLALFGVFLFTFILGGTVWLLTPKIYDFKPATAKSYQLGESGTFIWRISSFPRRLTVVEFTTDLNDSGTPPIPTDLTAEQRSSREAPFVAKANRNYVLEMESQLSRFPNVMNTLGITTVVRATPSVPITVAEADLAINLSADRLSVVVGEEVQLKWQNVNMGEHYILLVDGERVALTDPAEVGDGSRSYTDVPQKNTRYQLAVDGSLIGEISSNIIAVEVLQPTPVIQEFRVAPAEVAPGDIVNVFWRVAGIDDMEIKLTPASSATLQREGELQIQIPTLQPFGTYEFAIEAIAKGTPVSMPGVNQRSAFVNIAPATPMPSATPAPTPAIRRFNVEPKEVILGDPVRISWDVAGANEIVISPAVGKVEVNTGERLVPMTSAGPQQVILQAKAVAPASTGVAEQIIDVNVLAPTATSTATGTPKPPPALPEIKQFFIIATPVQGEKFEFQWDVANTFDKLEIRSIPSTAYPALTLEKSAIGRVEYPRIAQQPATFELAVFQGNEVKAVKTAELEIQARSPALKSVTVTDLAENNLSGCRAGDLVTICNLPVDKEVVIVGWNIDNATTVIVDAPVRCINGSNDNLAATGHCIFTVDKNVSLIIRAGNAPVGLIKIDPVDLWQVSLVREQFVVVGPPQGFNGGLTIDSTQVTLGWTGPVIGKPDEVPTNLVKYRIYRASIGELNFSLVAEPATAERTWTDGSGNDATEVCGKAYYMVSVYKAINSTGEEEDRESDPTATFNTLPCS